MDSDLTSGVNPISGNHVVVIGGGIAGLAAAHRLATTDPGVRVTLLEADRRLGGKIATEQVDGFVIEAGPDSFLAVKPRGVGLSEEIGLDSNLQGVTSRSKRAFILHQDRLHELPEGLSGLVPTRLAPVARSRLLTLRGKARVALDYVLPARSGDSDESVGGFMRRRLGNEAWELLVEPLMAGIYAADGDQLSLAATFPQLRAAERNYGGVIRGVLAARGQTQPSQHTRSPFLTPAGGLGALVSALEVRLQASGVVIRTGAVAESVFPVESGYEVTIVNGPPLRADALIIATPAFAASNLLDDIDAALAGELAAIPHASTTIVSLAFRREQIPHPLDGHGYVIPRVEGGPILACTWSSRKWAGRAPEGWELIRLFIGRAGDRNEAIQAADEQALIALALQEVATRLGISAKPSLTRVQRWPKGMPQYIMGHPERVSRIEALLDQQLGLFLAGNGYRGVGLPDCIASGERAAKAALEYLARRGANSGLGELAAAPMATPGDERFHLCEKCSLRPA